MDEDWREGFLKEEILKITALEQCAFLREARENYQSSINVLKLALAKSFFSGVQKFIV